MKSFNYDCKLLFWQSSIFWQSSYCSEYESGQAPDAPDICRGGQGFPKKSLHAPAPENLYEGAGLPFMYRRGHFLYGSVRVKFRFNSRKSPVHSSRTAPVHVRERTGVVREYFSSPIKHSRTCTGENSRIFPAVYGRKDEYFSISRTPPVHLPHMYGRSAPSLKDLTTNDFTSAPPKVFSSTSTMEGG